MQPWPLPLTPGRCSSAPRRPPPGPWPTARTPPRCTTSGCPTGRPRDVTVVVVHGGFWQPEFDRAHAAAAVPGVRRRRLHRRRAGVPPGRHGGGGWPGTFDDITRGPRRGPRRPHPPGPLVLVGHSAGGHLAVWAASQPWAHGLAGAVSLAGCRRPDPHRTLGLGDRAAQSLMGGDPEGALLASYALADPARLTPAVPVRPAARDAGRDGAAGGLPAPTRSGCRPARPPRRGAAGDGPRLRALRADRPDHPAFATVLATVRTLAA